MQNKYRMSSGLRAVKEEPFFETDKEAWDYLRKILNGPSNDKNIFVTLFKEQKTEVPFNNAPLYISEYNSTYGPKPIGMGGETSVLLDINAPNIHSIWIPILEGLTQHEYNPLVMGKNNTLKQKVYTFPDRKLFGEFDLIELLELKIRYVKGEIKEQLCYIYENGMGAVWDEFANPELVSDELLEQKERALLTHLLKVQMDKRVAKRENTNKQGYGN